MTSQTHNCGFTNQAGAVYCASCGFPLKHSPAPQIETIRDPRHDLKRYAVTKNSFIATVLAFVPGIGQLYNGDYKKLAFVWITMSILVSFSAAIFPILIALGLYGWSIVDAYSVAKGRSPLW